MTVVSEPFAEDRMNRKINGANKRDFTIDWSFWNIRKTFCRAKKKQSENQKAYKDSWQDREIEWRLRACIVLGIAIYYVVCVCIRCATSSWTFFPWFSFFIIYWLLDFHSAHTTIYTFFKLFAYLNLEYIKCLQCSSNESSSQNVLYALSFGLCHYCVKFCRSFSHCFLALCILCWYRAFGRRQISPLSHFVCIEFSISSRMPFFPLLLKYVHHLHLFTVLTLIFRRVTVLWN